MGSLGRTLQSNASFSPSRSDVFNRVGRNSTERIGESPEAGETRGGRKDSMISEIGEHVSVIPRSPSRCSTSRLVSLAQVRTVALVVVYVAAAVHVYILILEMFLWTRPIGRRAFGLSPELAEQTKTLAAKTLKFGAARSS